MRIRTGDNVIMLTGKDRGKSGKVLRVLPEDAKVLVEGLNLVKKHQRPKKQGQKGEVVSAPRAVDASDVMLICRHCKKASRMGIKREDKNIIRVCKKCKGEN
ncbi:MAG: 50S ribosomal protein L24 [Parcubacteria group bacterium]|nr:50S ribosomal protein L24 [Parcubacteria group bacterium]